MNVIIDGIEYVTVRTTGSRAMVVIDRGWIFAGDVTETAGRIRLDRVVWVFRWKEVGFDGVIADPKSESVTLRRLKQPIDLPADAEVFRIPVGDDWGL